MFGLGGIASKLMLYGILAGVLSGAIALAYNHYTSLQEEIKVLYAENQKKDMAIQQQQATINQQIEQAAKNAELNTQLNARLRESEDRTGRLRKLLMDHDLTRLAYEKPGLIERRINDATKNVFDDLGRITSTPN